MGTLNSEITFYDIRLGSTVGSIEGRNDLWGGRSKEDLISAKSQKRNRCFTSLCYSADGGVILAGGRYVCTQRHVCSVITILPYNTVETYCTLYRDMCSHCHAEHLHHPKL